MRRKLIKQGGGGFTIYLPKKWVDEHKLKPTDYVDISETEDNLLISTSKPNKKTCSIDLHSTSKLLLEKILLQAYRSGFDSIILKNINLELKNILNILNKTIGMEILSKEGDVIKLIIYDSSEEFDVQKILLKGFQGAKMLYSEFLESDFSKSSLKNIIELQLSFEKQCNFFRRGFSKYSNEKYISFSGQTIIRTLNVLTNKIRYFSNHFISTKSKPSKELLKGIKMIFDDLTLLSKGIYGSPNELLDLGEHKYEQIKYCDQFIKKEPLIGGRLYEGITLLSHLFSTFLSMEITYDLGVSLKENS